MSHPFDKLANCQCARCVKERLRRAHQSADSAASQIFKRPIRVARVKPRVASREEQHARYIDCGPGAWDDRE